MSKEEVKFKVGESVICIINSRASLTVGKEYKVKRVYNDYDVSLSIDNDYGYEIDYDQMRFLSKDIFRNKIINQIID